MAEIFRLVNGLPGSGKTTLATALAPILGLPLIAKDRLKEAIQTAAPDLPSAGIGPAAARLMWDLARSVEHAVLLESWWFRPRDLAFAEEGLRHAQASTIVEIWCDVPPELARDRDGRSSPSVPADAGWRAAWLAEAARPHTEGPADPNSPRSWPTRQCVKFGQPADPRSPQSPLARQRG